MVVDGGTIYGLENIEKRKEKYSLVGHDIVVDADVCVIGSGASRSNIGRKTGKWRQRRQEINRCDSGKGWIL